MRITGEQVRSLFDYDPETGSLRWKRRVDVDERWNGRYPGSVAGQIHRNKKGSNLHYIRIRLAIEGTRRCYLGHTLAWVWMTGEWPLPGIDHADTDGTNNRWLNLRLATASQNSANARLSALNTTGFKGVYLQPGKRKWRAQIRKDDRLHYLGMFDTPEGAHAAYIVAANEFHGEFARAK